MLKILKTKGFTLIEVSVALGILTVGMLGVSSLVIQNSQAQNINQNYLIASMLAQEGAELIRNKRDLNWLKENWYEWATSSAPSTDTDIVQLAGGGVYTVNYDGVINNSVSSHADPGAQLFVNGAGYYSHSGAASTTPFSRLVRATNLGDHISFVVEVRWSERGRDRDYDVNFDLYNWR